MALTKKQKTELLGRVELFSAVGKRALGQVADLASEVEFAAGRYIVRQGEVGTGFFLIVGGRARAVRGGEVLARFGPGDFFGELSVLDGAPRVANVIADEQTACLGLASWDFTRLLEQNPKLMLAILREVARRLRAASEHHRH